MLGCILAYLAAKGDDRVGCATFFVSLLDFSQPGELGVFVDEEQVANLEKKMNERGILKGSEMATTFNMLRANDLVWSFVINNYLLGKDPFPFDLLYWNSDSTRMPAKMHSFYLRNMYLKNLLGVPAESSSPASRSSFEDEAAGVLRLDHRRSHCAVENHLQGRQAPRRPGEVYPRRLGPHRRHRQPAGGEEV